MIRYTAIILLTLLAFTACKPKTKSTELEEFVKEFDSISLPEAKVKLAAQLEQLDAYIKFTKSGFFSDNKSEAFKKEDEKYEDVFTVPGNKDVKQQFQELLPQLQLHQEVMYPESRVSVKTAEHFRSPLLADDEVNIMHYTAKATYYKDGTVDKEESDLDEETTWDNCKVIDSALVKVSYDYLTTMTAHELRRSNSIVNLNGSEIRLKRIDKNVVSLAVADDVYKKLVKVQALNEDGKYLDRKGYQVSNMPPGEMEKSLKSFRKKLEELIKKLDNNKYKDINALKADIRSELSGEVYFEETGTRYIENTYYGNVASIIVYTADSRKTEEQELIIRNPAPNHAKLVYARDSKTAKYGFLDSSGHFAIAPAYEDLECINDHYFSMADSNANVHYYRLDEAAKKLVPMNEYHSLTRLNNKLAIASLENGNEGVIDGNGKVVVPVTYSELIYDESSQLLFTTIQNSRYGLLTPQGQTVLPSQYGAIEGFSDGLALVQKPDRDGYYGFIDMKGKKVISLDEYERVYSFTDGVALVEKGGKSAYIGTNGKIVIPFKYREGKPFEEGVTSVVNDEGETGLINLKGEIVLPFKAYSSIMIGTGKGSRSYQFDGQEYDAKGKPVKKEKAE